ncbi:MAG: hypothetical protein AAF211_03875 [Myxococcota bacterium]
MWLALLVSTLGHAQSPLNLGPRGEARWVTEDVEAERFLSYEGEAAGPKLFKGDEVELIVASGDKVRIKKGSRYGWVSATVLTAEAPENDLGGSNLTNNPLLVPTTP